MAKNVGPFFLYERSNLNKNCLVKFLFKSNFFNKIFTLKPNLILRIGKHYSPKGFDFWQFYFVKFEAIGHYKVIFGCTRILL